MLLTPSVPSGPPPRLANPSHLERRQLAARAAPSPLPQSYILANHGFDEDRTVSLNSIEEICPAKNSLLPPKQSFSRQITPESTTTPTSPGLPLSNGSQARAPRRKNERFGSIGRRLSQLFEVSLSAQTAANESERDPLSPNSTQSVATNSLVPISPVSPQTPVGGLPDRSSSSNTGSRPSANRPSAGSAQPSPLNGSFSFVRRAKESFFGGPSTPRTKAWNAGAEDERRSQSRDSDDSPDEKLDNSRSTDKSADSRGDANGRVTSKENERRSNRKDKHADSAETRDMIERRKRAQQQIRNERGTNLIAGDRVSDLVRARKASARNAYEHY